MPLQLWTQWVAWETTRLTIVLSYQRTMGAERIELPVPNGRPGYNRCAGHPQYSHKRKKPGYLSVPAPSVPILLGGTTKGRTSGGRDTHSHYGWRYPCRLLMSTNGKTVVTAFSRARRSVPGAELAVKPVTKKRLDTILGVCVVVANEVDPRPTRRRLPKTTFDQLQTLRRPPGPSEGRTEGSPP